VAAGASPETVNIAKRAIHAHDDGTVVFAVQLSDLWEPERRVTGAHGQVKLLGEDQIASGILNGLFIAGRHAREVARASGGIFAQAQVKFGSSSLGWGYQIGHQRSGIVDASGATILRRNPPPSTTQADLDDLTLPSTASSRGCARHDSIQKTVSCGEMAGRRTGGCL
jgi:hypothetical protein